MGNDIISNIVEDKQYIKNQLGGSASTIPALKKFSSSFKPYNVAIIIEKKDISSAFIWGSSKYGIWGVSKWSDDNTLQKTLVAVIPYNNLFVEYFRFNNFIDTAQTTASIDYNTNTLTATAGDVFVSNVIAKYNSPITKVKILEHPNFISSGGEMVLGSLQLGITTFSDDNVLLYVSNDAGTTWYSIKENEDFYFPTSSNNDELKYKIEFYDNITISSPIYIQIN